MKAMENDYYEKKGVHKPPYENPPAYPPKYQNRDTFKANNRSFADSLQEIQK